MGRRQARRLPAAPVLLEITDLGHDGRGVGRVEDKAVFVHGALPGEQVRARLIARNRRHDEAVCVEVVRPSPDRIESSPTATWKWPFCLGEHPGGVFAGSPRSRSQPCSGHDRLRQ